MGDLEAKKLFLFPEFGLAGDRATLDEGGGADTEMSNSATSREERGADGLHGETQFVVKKSKNVNIPVGDNVLCMKRWIAQLREMEKILL